VSRQFSSSVCDPGRERLRHHPVAPPREPGRGLVEFVGQFGWQIGCHQADLGIGHPKAPEFILPYDAVRGAALDRPSAAWP
jgi:hypothetical protein